MKGFRMYSDEMTIRDRLFQTGIMALEKEGWTVGRVRKGQKGASKGSVRQITKGTDTRLACIRTTRDGHIAFLRNDRNDGWATLDDVDYVCAVSVDNSARPMWASAHIIKQSEIVQRFDRAYKARLAAGYSIQAGRGMWLSLYQEEAEKPLLRVGAGVAREKSHSPILKLSLWNDR